MRAKLGLLLLAGALTSCGEDVRGLPMAINDPLGLIDDIEGSLRVFVIPAETHRCEPTTGLVSPEIPDVAEGMVAEAVADVSVDVTNSRATTMLTVAAGEYTVLVRGKGTDPVSGRTDVFIATACQTTTIERDETREVRLTLIPIFGQGVCGDGLLSPDEHCEDGGTTDGDGCSATCRTEPFELSTTNDEPTSRPSVAGAVGQRWVATWTRGATETYLRLLDPDGSPIVTPSVLTNDSDIDSILTTEAVGTELLARVATSESGRIALSFVEFPPSSGQARAAFLAQNRTPEAPSESLGRDTDTSDPAVAVSPDGAALVVFSDAGTSSGLGARAFTGSSSTPSGPDVTEVGSGTTAGRDAVVAAASDHFAVVFESGGAIQLQRFGLDGTPTDASASVVSEGGVAPSKPSVAALPDGRLLVVWQDTQGDESGTAVLGRSFGADGAAGEVFTINSTGAGDQTAPRVAAGSGLFAVTFESGGGIRARLFSGDGAAVPNREQPPTTAEFEVASQGSSPDIATGGTTAAPTVMVVYASNDGVRGRVYPLP